MNRRLPWLLLLLAGAGCADEASLAAARPPTPCATESECSSGFICVMGRCVDEMISGPDNVSIEITPPSSSRYTRTQILDMPLSNVRGPVDLALPLPTEYSVTLLDDNSEPQPLSGKLSIYGSPRIPEREVELSQLIAANPVRPQLFRLVEGAYTVRIRPNDERYPPFEVTGFNVRAQQEQGEKTFSVPTKYRRLSGLVHNATSGEPIRGAAVRAIARVSGLTSTIAISSASGHYSLLLPETADNFYQVEAEPPLRLRPSWSYRGSIRVTDDRAHDIPLEQSDDQVRGTLTLRVISAGAMPEGVANADVVITSTSAPESSAPETKTFRVAGRTDSNGLLKVDVLGRLSSDVPIVNATFLIDVTPPEGSPYGRPIVQKTVQVSVGEGESAFEYQVKLGLRTVMSGSVLTPQGSALAGALIDFEPLNGLRRANGAQSDERGQYQVELDAGEYLAIIQPAQAIGAEGALPTLVRKINVENVDTKILDFTLPRGAVLQGHTGDAANRVAHAELEFFIRLEGHTVSVGRSESDADGAFTQVLAAD